jgi:hypothetical protein
MGFTPAQVGDMSFWHFTAAFEGFARVNGWTTGAATSAPMGDARLSELGIDGF